MLWFVTFSNKLLNKHSIFHNASPESLKICFGLWGVGGGGGHTMTPANYTPMNKYNDYSREKMNSYQK